jgi:putative nucleotidyltransferase-like protein
MSSRLQWSALGDSPEWQIVLACASARPDSSQLTEFLTNCDWPALLELADAHGVTTLLAQRLHAFDVLVPASFQHQLLEMQRAHVLSALALIVEMIRIQAKFIEADLQTLVLKGPALSLQAYGDATVRQYGDVDLLVRHDDIGRATQLLIEAGFHPTVPVAAVTAERIPGEYQFSRPNTKVIVELHTERTLRYFPNRLPIEQLFGRATTLDVNGNKVATLSLEDALVWMCTHGAKHFWERLMWVADLAAMIERQQSLHWNAASEIAVELGAQRIVHIGVLLACELLGARPPQEVEKRARQDHTACALVREIETWLPATGQASPKLLRRVLFRARMRGGLFHGIGYVTRLSLSPTEEDWREEHLHKNARFRETARRLVRLAKKYGAASNRQEETSKE